MHIQLHGFITLFIILPHECLHAGNLQQNKPLSNAGNSSSRITCSSYAAKIQNYGFERLGCQIDPAGNTALDLKARRCCYLSRRIRNTVIRATSQCK